MSRNLMAVAGEISGDLHLGAVLEELRKLDPELTVWGIGGVACELAGMELRVHARDMAVLGVAEVLKRYGFFRRVFHGLLAEVDRRKPDAVLLVDYPGFNLRLAKQLHARKIKVIYYICPQVWAWKKGRMAHMIKWLDRLLVIFPFEVDVFQGSPLRAEFVGHPLVGEAEAMGRMPSESLPWGDGEKIALLPGSRSQELVRHAELLFDVAERTLRRRPEASFLIPAASVELEGDLQKGLAGRSQALRSRIRIVSGKARHILRQADVALVASGTVTIEAALQNCPMMILYRTSWLTYQIGRRVVKIPWLGMVNIVAGREICPEYIQDRAQAEIMADDLDLLLSDPNRLQKMRDDLRLVSEALHGGGAASRVAAVVHEELQSAPSSS